MNSTPSPMSSTHAPRRWWIFIASAIACVLLILGGAIASFVPLARSLLRAKTAAQAAEVDVRTGNLSTARDHLRDAREYIFAARDQAAHAGLWRTLPILGIHIRAVEDASAAAGAAIESGIDVIDVGLALQNAVETARAARAEVRDTTAGRSYRSLSREEKREALRALSESVPRIRLARDKMELALALWERVPETGLVSPFRRALQPLADTIPMIERGLQESTLLLDVLPLAGYPTPQRYLIALQNSDEQRGSGGFIGNIGTMDVDAGDVTHLSFTDVYAVDNPVIGQWKDVPPEPIRRWLGQEQWYMRDANWSPDFPTAAETILDKYEREKALQGATSSRPTVYVAIEPGFFRELLKLTGPLTLDGETYDADNFFDKIEYNVEIGFLQQGLPVNKRKGIVSQLGQQLFARVSAMPSSEWPKLLDLTMTALEERQIMIYAREKALMAAIDARGWSGRAKATNGDFLWVVDSNLAALKTDGVMEKRIGYAVNMQDPRGPVATVTLSYRNTNPKFTWRYTRYRSYTRIYVPEGSELLETTGAMKDDVSKTGGKPVPGHVDVYRDLGKTVFGAFWSIEPGNTGTLRFTYRLPPSVLSRLYDGQYHLDWQKQPGTDTARLTLALRFGKKITSATPSEDTSQWGDDLYTTEVDSRIDRSFDIRF